MNKNVLAALAVLSALLLSACSPPPLAVGLPHSFGPTPDFDRRARQLYPVDSEEAKLFAELRRERFTITEIHEQSGPKHRSAVYDLHDFPCRETWTVDWTYDHGAIDSIQGSDSGDLCL